MSTTLPILSSGKFKRFLKNVECSITVDWKPGTGVSIDEDIINNMVVRVIEDLHNHPEQHLVYCRCGERMIVVERDEVNHERFYVYDCIVKRTALL